MNNEQEGRKAQKKAPPGLSFRHRGSAGGMPSEETVDFTVDRPFPFVITGGRNLPLFAGVVNGLG